MASLILSTIYTTTVLVGSWEYLSGKPALSSLKDQIEAEADPYLSKRSKSEIARARETKGVGGGPYGGGVVPVYEDEVSVKIREHLARFDASMLRVTSEHKDSELLFLLWLKEGTYLDPGVQFWNLISMYLYNMLGDFLAAFVLMQLLGLAEKLYHPRWKILLVLSLLLVGPIMMLLNLLPYGLLASGATAAFFWLLIEIPLSVIAVSLGLFGLCSAVLACVDGIREKEYSGLFTTSFFLVWGCAWLGGVYTLWSKSQHYKFFGELGLPEFSSAYGPNWPPYALAATAQIPFLLGVFGLLIALLAGCIGETVRKPIALYLRAVLQMGKPVLLLLCATPTGIVEAIKMLYEAGVIK
ncbi:MAG: hypothetical protein ACYTE3_21255 [Planctomycetota bacterium]